MLLLTMPINKEETFFFQSSRILISPILKVVRARAPNTMEEKANVSFIGECYIPTMEHYPKNGGTEWCSFGTRLLSYLKNQLPKVNVLLR